MKEKCFSLMISIVIMVSGIVLSAVIQFVPLGLPVSVQNYFVTIFAGAAASAIVTSIIYASDYKIARTSTLEAFWEAELEIINTFFKMKYFKCNVPVELLQDYYYEKRHNDMVDENRSRFPQGIDIPDMEDFSYRHDALDKWCDLIVPKHIQLKEVMTEAEFRRCLVRDVEHEWDDCINEINSILDGYISLTQIRLKKINNILGQLKFFTDIFRRKEKRKKTYIHDKLYTPIREKLREIQAESYHFGLYRNNNGNFAVVLNKLLELQKEFYTVEIRDIGDYEETSIYFDFQFKMDTELEYFRSKIIYHSEPEYMDRQLFAQHMERKSESKD